MSTPSLLQVHDIYNLHPNNNNIQHFPQSIITITTSYERFAL